MLVNSAVFPGIYVSTSQAVIQEIILTIYSLQSVTLCCVLNGQTENASLIVMHHYGLKTWIFLTFVFQVE